MPLPGKNTPITADTLRQDIPNVIAFLRVLEKVAPGRVPEELLAELDGVARNALSLELLATAMNAGR